MVTSCYLFLSLSYFSEEPVIFVIQLGRLFFSVEGSNASTETFNVGSLSFPDRIDPIAIADRCIRRYQLTGEVPRRRPQIKTLPANVRTDLAVSGSRMMPLGSAPCFTA